MSDIALLHVTFGTVEEAEQVARAMVEERLAACANVMASCISIYRWGEGVEQEVETPVLFKTTMEQALALRDRIAELHSYDLPVIELWPAAATEAAARWINDAIES
ncbi:divalent-cation tolerance protein CutA [Sphingomonas baiyangensis]|uniref:Divalent-cation tolerance protein CutA n=1 Tax=Sphingomonas baiyangensis TaxID=2572576 RepID=A0A4U1L8K4_9SPHN|nr:divalent-cation tolerance protein CutA [Sphingomonas baiyangensis]TKD52833.1 divalent-cation tolerance protein CutA [Sphingomonas baiyangensis]